MTRFWTLAAAAGALAAFVATPASAISSVAECEANSGFTINANGALVCMVPIRAEEFHGEEYDDAGLGVKECDGEVTNSDEWCKITLRAAPARPNVSTTPPAEAALTPTGAEVISDQETREVE